MKVPKRMTSVSQQAGVDWNFPFKARLRQLWHEVMQGPIPGPRIAGKKYKLKPPDRPRYVAGTLCLPRLFPMDLEEPSSNQVRAVLRQVG
jgi:hypothetical protein